ncbi:MAG: hypothetical protein Q4C49_00760 [Bacillota bacterium]|nr:hypothetical protein [Bacillota bacterium]
MITPNNGPSYLEKKSIYTRYFSSGNNTFQSFDNKMELLTLICFLTQKMSKKDPEKYPNAKAVLDMIFKDSIDWADSDYVIGLSIVADDLLFGTVTEIKNPGEYKNAKEIVSRIKELIEQWMPF